MVSVGGEFGIFGKDFLRAVSVFVDPVASPGVELEAVLAAVSVFLQQSGASANRSSKFEEVV